MSDRGSVAELEGTGPDSTATTEFLGDVLEALAREPKQLRSTYFYDERGSALFERITELPEYYLTARERSIMEAHAPQMAAQLGHGVMLVEFGSGSSSKTRVLLDHLEEPAAYVPVDVSEDHLLESAADLRGSYPDIEILPLVADFTQPLELPESKRTPSHAAVYLPGSTIGNFTSDEALELLRGIARQVGVQGGLLIGIDLQKDPAVIEAAYNDSAGVTAEFNLNLLRRINHELEADFDTDAFRHQAVYDEVEGRIESSLVSTRQQTVTVSGQRFDFAAGEELLTEYSHKYTIESFAEMAGQCGFVLHKSWTDPDRYFAVLHLVIDS